MQILYIAAYSLVLMAFLTTVSNSNSLNDSLTSTDCCILFVCKNRNDKCTDCIGLVAKWLWTLSLGGIDKIRHHLVVYLIYSTVNSKPHTFWYFLNTVVHSFALLLPKRHPNIKWTYEYFHLAIMFTFGAKEDEKLWTVLQRFVWRYEIVLIN